MCQSSLVGPLAITGPNKTGATTRKLVISRVRQVVWLVGVVGEREKRGGSEREKRRERERERKKRRGRNESRRRLKEELSFQCFRFLPLLFSLPLLTRGGFRRSFLVTHRCALTRNAHSLIDRVVVAPAPSRADGSKEKKRRRSTSTAASFPMPGFSNGASFPLVLCGVLKLMSASQALSSLSNGQGCAVRERKRQARERAKPRRA